VIIDFTASQGDKIDLSAIDAVAGGTSANDAFTLLVAMHLREWPGSAVQRWRAHGRHQRAICRPISHILNNVTTLAANSLVL